MWAGDLERLVVVSLETEGRQVLREGQFAVGALGFDVAPLEDVHLAEELLASSALQGLVGQPGTDLAGEAPVNGLGKHRVHVFFHPKVGLLALSEEAAPLLLGIRH